MFYSAGNAPLMKTILIIDDNFHFCEALVEMIDSRLLDVSIERASDGPEGLEKVKGLSPHLVFVDIHLPGESGLELVCKIKAIDPDIIIAAFTSYDLPETSTHIYKFKAVKQDVVC